MTALPALPAALNGWSAIGLGTWAMGGAGWRYAWGRQDDAVSAATIVRAVELGINWIDTAPVYGVGHAERLVGRTLAAHGLRRQVRLASKCGFLWQPGSRRPYPRLTGASVLREAEASLRRLGTDYLDLYQIHWPGPDCDIDAAWESIGRLIEQGKVRAGGVCNLQRHELARLHRRRAVCSLQLPYHLLERSAERELLPFCAGHGVGVLAYSPLASGILTASSTRAGGAACPVTTGAPATPPSTARSLPRICGRPPRCAAMPPPTAVVPSATPSPGRRGTLR